MCNNAIHSLWNVPRNEIQKFTNRNFRDSSFQTYCTVCDETHKAIVTIVCTIHVWLTMPSNRSDRIALLDRIYIYKCGVDI